MIFGRIERLTFVTVPVSPIVILVVSPIVILVHPVTRE